jgi:hypothetical protein
MRCANGGTNVVGRILDRPLLAWFLTRLAALALGGLAVAMVRGNVFFDTEHYARWAHGTVLGTSIPYQDFPWEYPPGALPPIVVPGLLTWWYPGRPGHAYFMAYGTGWVVFMLAMDAWVLRVLRRHAGASRHPALTLWLLAPPLLGALTWARYDLLPAGLALAAVLAAGSSSTRASGLWAGFGGTLKLWPLLLAPIQRTRRACLRSSAIAGTVLALTAGSTYLLTGQTGFNQVLRYQNQRGLQIESFAALPIVWLRHLHVRGNGAHFRFGAYEVTGPSTAWLAAATSALYVVGLALLAFAHWRFTRRDAGPTLVALTAMGFMMLTIVTNKVFSPQYMLWLIAVLAGACLLDPQTWRPYVPWVLLSAGLTAMMFPWLYADVLGHGWIGLLALTARDVVLLGIAIAVAREVIRAVKDRPQSRDAATATVGPGPTPRAYAGR